MTLAEALKKYIKPCIFLDWRDSKRSHESKDAVERYYLYPATDSEMEIFPRPTVMIGIVEPTSLPRGYRIPILSLRKIQIALQAHKPIDIAIHMKKAADGVTV